MGGVKTGAKLVEKPGKIKRRLADLMHESDGARQALRFLAEAEIALAPGIATV